MREKLIELLWDAFELVDNELPTVEQVADHLIAHGVTVQKWIPVTERLPEDGVRVLVAHDDGVVRIGISEGGFPAVMVRSRLYQPLPLAEVTHWMPLPQPPTADMRGE